MFVELAKLYGLASLFLLFCAINGFALLQLLKPWQGSTTVNPYLKWFFAISIGLMLNITVLFILGLAGLLNLPAVLGMGSVMLAVAVLIIRPFAKLYCKITRALYAELAVLVLFLTVILLSAMHAPGHWDDTSFHLPIARSLLQHEAIIVNEYLRFPLFPQNINLLLALGLMLGGDLSAQVFATLPVFIMIIGLLGTAQWITGSIIPGILAAATLIAIKPVQSYLGYAYIDNGLALFCWGATLAIALWLHIAQKKRAYALLIIAGVLAGGAAGSKYFGAVFAILTGIYLLLIRRDWKASALFALVVTATGSWWYIRSFLISGDPLHPAGGNIFGHFLWDATDLLLQKTEQASHGVKPGSLDIWGALQKAGIWPWILAIATLALRNLPVPVRYFQFIFFSYLVFWFFVTQVNRYLAPIYATGTFLSWYLLYRAYLLIVGRYFSAARYPISHVLVSLFMAMSLPAWLTWSQYKKAMPAMTEFQSRLEHATGYILFSRANTMKHQYGNRLIQVGFENAIYFFDGTVIGDHFGPGRYRNMQDCSNGSCMLIAPLSMKVLMEGFGARMLAVSAASKFDKDAYREYFDFIMEDKYGQLMVLKSGQ